MRDEDLLRVAREAAAGAYAPYSGFRVGAAVLTEDGEVFSGSNVENAAYPSGICAEANAVGSAVAAGARKLQKVAVVCLDADGLEGAYPCGQCRQRMSEFSTSQVIVGNAGDEWRVHTLDELLPHQFRL